MSRLEPTEFINDRYARMEANLEVRERRGAEGQGGGKAGAEEGAKTARPASFRPTDRRADRLFASPLFTHRSCAAASTAP